VQRRKSLDIASELNVEEEQDALQLLDDARSVRGLVGLGEVSKMPYTACGLGDQTDHVTTPISPTMSRNITFLFPPAGEDNS
jgi:hypothetical protein